LGGETVSRAEQLPLEPIASRCPEHHERSSGELPDEIGGLRGAYGGTIEARPGNRPKQQLLGLRPVIVVPVPAQRHRRNAECGTETLGDERRERRVGTAAHGGRNVVDCRRIEAAGNGDVDEIELRQLALDDEVGLFVDGSLIDGPFNPHRPVRGQQSGQFTAPRTACPQDHTGSGR
jgi:hypothetical protein